MVAEFKRFPLGGQELSPGMNITIATVKADENNLRTLQETARQKLQGNQPLTSEEQAALIIEKQNKETAEREARRAAVEARRNSTLARLLRAIGEIW